MSGSRKARRSPDAALERRYRRLLAWYPARYVAANGEEMLGVVLAGAAPDQSRPDRGEAISLVASGIRMRFGRMFTGARSPAWRGAGAAFALLGSVLLTAVYRRALAGQIASGLPGGSFGAGGLAGQLGPSLGFRSFSGVIRFLPGVSANSVIVTRSGVSVPAVGIVLAAGWFLVVVAALLRWRRVAAGAALLSAAWMAGHAAAGYATAPSSLVAFWWLLLLALVTALAAMTSLSGPRSETRLLPRPVIAATGAAATLFVVAPLVESAFTHVGARTVSNPLFSISGLLTDGLILLLGVTLLISVVLLDHAVRRRVLVLFAPVAAVYLLVNATFGGFIVSSPRFAHPVLLAWPQWVSLWAAPLLVFAAGMVWIRRHERILKAIAAGPGGEPTPG